MRLPSHLNRLLFSVFLFASTRKLHLGTPSSVFTLRNTLTALTPYLLSERCLPDDKLLNGVHDYRRFCVVPLDELRLDFVDDRALVLLVFFDEDARDVRRQLEDEGEGELSLRHQAVVPLVEREALLEQDGLVLLVVVTALPGGPLLALDLDDDLVAGHRLEDVQKDVPVHNLAGEVERLLGLDEDVTLLLCLLVSHYCSFTFLPNSEDSCKAKSKKIIISNSRSVTRARALPLFRVLLYPNTRPSGVFCFLKREREAEQIKYLR